MDPSEGPRLNVIDRLRQAWQKMAREELACFAARWVHCAERTAVWGVKISKGQSMLELKQKLGTCLQLILYNYRGIPEK